MVEGLLWLLAGDESGPVNLGNPEETSILKLAEAVQEAAGATPGCTTSPRCPTPRRSTARIPPLPSASSARSPPVKRLTPTTPLLSAKVDLDGGDPPCATSLALVASATDGLIIVVVPI